MLLLACEQAHLFWGIQRVFWRRSRHSKLWGGKNFSRGFRRVVLEALPPGYPPDTTNKNCLIEVKNTITIKLEIRSFCALSSVPAPILPPEDWAGKRRKRAEKRIFFRFLLQLNLSTMGTKGSGR